MHRECSAIVVLNAQGKVVLEAVLETKTQTVLDCITGSRGTVLVTVEEGAPAAWRSEGLRPPVAAVLGCAPCKNKLLSEGNKGDQVAAGQVAQEPGALGQTRKQGPQLIVHPAVECSRTAPFEGKEDAQGDHFTGPETGLGMLRHGFHRFV